ncbi:MAG TPA: hypothetical protein DCM86_03585 [Verrucomicrobiales bacterium]|nr:hypothetical protein [Verrucomicrobiales bacterium]
MKPSEHHRDDPFLDRQLRELPPPPAPASLVGNVMRRVGARATRAWWQRPILEWPAHARWAGVVALLGVALAFGYLAGWIPTPDEDFGVTLRPETSLAPWQLLWVGANAFRASVATSAAALPTLYWWVAGGALLAIYGGCLGLGTLVYRRIAAERPS